MYRLLPIIVTYQCPYTEKEWPISLQITGLFGNIKIKRIIH